MTIDALLILGHSASGKSPLGELIARECSTPHQRFLHFDFGQMLRCAAAGETGGGLSDDERKFIRTILNGTLLDDAHFPLAHRLLSWFCDTAGFCPGRDCLVLNGLPRHCGQARALEELDVRVQALFHLKCTPREAWLRMRLAAGGTGHEDRSTRQDDTREIFECRLRSFEADTLPLIDWYAHHAVPCVTVPLDARTTAREMLDAVRPVCARLPGRPDAGAGS